MTADKERRQVHLNRDRNQKGPLGTYGYISTGTFKCCTLERPPDGDHPCIPLGEYDVDWTDDGRHPLHNPCYEVLNVPGRTAILIHAANWFEELQGCIAPGSAIGKVEGAWKGQVIAHKGITGSKVALGALCADLECENFRLIITET